MISKPLSLMVFLFRPFPVSLFHTTSRVKEMESLKVKNQLVAHTSMNHGAALSGGKEANLIR